MILSSTELKAVRCTGPMYAKFLCVVAPTGIKGVLLQPLSASSIDIFAFYKHHDQSTLIMMNSSSTLSDASVGIASIDRS